jgi:predicted DNA-binding transcriptional regulator AlpA
MTQAENGLIHIIIPKEPEDADVVWCSLPLHLKRLILRYKINGGSPPCNIIWFKKEKKKRRKSNGRWIRVDVAAKWTKVSMPTIYSWVRQGLVKKKGEFPMKIFYNDLRKVVAEKMGGG